METVLIRGCSCGFGLETAKYFLDCDGKVFATTRSLREDALPRSEHLRVRALDVTDPESSRGTIEAAGPIDALVNNAGFGAALPFEATPMAAVCEVFETNTSGAMATTQAALPQFTQRKAGVVVNDTSSVPMKSIALLAAYTAREAAAHAFTDSMALEQSPRARAPCCQGVRPRLALPITRYPTRKILITRPMPTSRRLLSRALARRTDHPNP